MDLTDNEREMLRFLKHAEDERQFAMLYEPMTPVLCGTDEVAYGPIMDSLLTRGLVELYGSEVVAPAPASPTLLSKTYRAVRLTAAGLAAAQ